MTLIKLFQTKQKRHEIILNEIEKINNIQIIISGKRR
jgi:hypothetical protein